jgi:hypothetical protein
MGSVSESVPDMRYMLSCDRKQVNDDGQLAGQVLINAVIGQV